MDLGLNKLILREDITRAYLSYKNIVEFLLSIDKSERNILIEEFNTLFNIKISKHLLAWTLSEPDKNRIFKNFHL